MNRSTGESTVTPRERPSSSARLDHLLRRGLWITLAVAAIARLLYWVQIRNADPFYAQTFPPMDMDLYWRWGESIAGGDWSSATFTQGGPFFFSPLYAYFLGILFRLFGAGYDAVHFANALIGLLPPVLVWAMTRQVFGRGAALAAGVLAALCAPFLFYGQLLLPDSLLPAVHAGLLYCLLRGQESKSRQGCWALAAGTLTALACWGRGNALLLIPGIGAAWLLLPRIGKASPDQQEPTARNEEAFQTAKESRQNPAAGTKIAIRFRSRRLAIRAVALYFLGAALFIAPTLVRNVYVSGRWVLVTANGPYNLYIGNAADSIGILSHSASHDTLVERYGGRESVPWGKELMADILSHPGQFFLHLISKFITFWNGYEVGDNTSYYATKSFSYLLRWDPVIWWTVVPLGILGFWRFRREWRDQLFLYVYGAVFPLSIIVVFISGRFRVEELLPLLVWAGAAVAGILQDIQERAWRRLVAAAAGFLLGIAALWPGWSPGRWRNAPHGPPWNAPLIRSVDYHNIATAHFRLGERLDARAWLEKGARAYPADPTFFFRLVTADVEEGEFGPAARELEDYLHRRPDDVRALLQLADIEVRLGHPDEARARLRRVLILDPKNAQAREMLNRIPVSKKLDPSEQPNETR